MRMKLNRLLLLGALIATLGTLKAQDIHFSLYNMSPLTLNPALTGAYEGTARLGGIYRDQWASFLPNQFTTPSFFIDAPIIRGFRKTDWVGVGMVTVNDQAGSAKLKTTMNMLSLSYHYALDNDRKTMLTLGIQGGSVQRSLDNGELIFGDALQSGQPTEEVNFEETSYLDFAAGLMLRSQISDISKLEVGLAFNHITQPKKASFQANPTDDDNRPMKIAVHSTFNSQLTDKLSIAPTVLFQTTAGATETALQAWGGYIIKEENPAEKKEEIKLNFGLGYRFADAGQVLLGMDYGPLRVAASYDVNLSSLNEVSNYQGGFELAAWYIFKIYKKPDTRPAIICPQF